MIYILVHDMSGVLNSENCAYLGLPEGSTFQDLREAAEQMDDRGSGYDRFKAGKIIWVAPYKSDPNIIFNPKPEIYEVLTLEELKNYNFDIIEDENI
tara:strand:+ start:15338 stop:15628 length:291 start_codon:yes stop_codon:yes gene_type:complete